MRKLYYLYYTLLILILSADDTAERPGDNEDIPMYSPHSIGEFQPPCLQEPCSSGSLEQYVSASRGGRVKGSLIVLIKKKYIY